MSDVPKQSRSQFGPLVVIVLSAVVLFIGAALTWPPLWVERRQQRATVNERVQASGGWDTVKRDCLSFAETNKSFYWSRGFNNQLPLPTTLAALAPVEVNCMSSETLSSQPANSSLPTVQGSKKNLNEFPSPEVPVGFNEKPNVDEVRIKFFGLHSTGGRSTPFYGIVIVGGPGSETYQPQSVHAASGNGHTNFRRIEDGIYEIY